jgi:cytochrome c553
MPIVASPRRRSFVYGVLAAFAAAVLLGAAFILSGVYNVAASARHFYLTEWFLELTLSRSIDTQSAGIDVPNLSHPELVRLGARHFVSGCQPCHAGPGLEPSPIAQGMYPAAPPLGDNVRGWKDRELFFIIRHGLKYTGMPQWSGDARGDEVWAMVAFVRQLPGMTPADYAAMTGASGPMPFDLSPVGPLVVPSCAGCHGDTESEPLAGLAPALRGQSASYLLRALDEYANGRRQSGMMEPIAAALSPAARRQLAEAFAAMQPADPSEAPAALTAVGEEIAKAGLPQQNVPACLSCHSAGRSPHFPRLEGLSAFYIANQLRLLREGVRDGGTHSTIMAPIARRLTIVQAEAVAAYFSAHGNGRAAVIVGEAAP